MRWTPHMDDILEHLSSSPEVPSDRILAAETRFMKIMDELQSVSAVRFFENESGRTPKTPLAIHVKGLLASLETTKKSIPPDVLERSAYPKIFSQSQVVTLANKIIFRTDPVVRDVR